MQKKKPSKPSSVLEELRALERQPVTKANRLLTRHLKCKKSIQLASAVARALGESCRGLTPALEAPTELLPPLA